MKRTLLVALISLSAVSVGVLAQGTSSGITESTDPAKAAEVERKAQEIQSKSQDTSGASSSKSKSSKQSKHGSSKKPAAKSGTDTSGTSAPVDADTK